jgi:hypothetical protein
MKPAETYRNQKLINGQWGYTYDQAKKMVLGGYSADGASFTHSWTVNGVAQKDVMFAVALCGLLFGRDAVEASYKDLVGDESRWRLLRYDVEIHNI